MLAALRHPAYPAAETLLLSFQRQVKLVKDSGVRHVAIQLLRLPSQYLFSLPKGEEETDTADENDAGEALQVLIGELCWTSILSIDLSM